MSTDSKWRPQPGVSGFPARSFLIQGRDADSRSPAELCEGRLSGPRQKISVNQESRSQMQMFALGATRERCRHNFRQLVFLKADIIGRLPADRQSPKNRVTKRPAIPIGNLSINNDFTPCSRHRHSKTSSFGLRNRSIWLENQTDGSQG
jgi:hypothetical protein